MNEPFYKGLGFRGKSSFKRNLIQDCRDPNFLEICRQFGRENDLLIVIVSDQNHISCFSARNVLK